VSVAAVRANRGRRYDQHRRSAATPATATPRLVVLPPKSHPQRNHRSFGHFWATKRIQIARYNHRRRAFVVAKVAGNRRHPRTTTTAVRESLGSGSPLPCPRSETSLPTGRVTTSAPPVLGARPTSGVLLTWTGWRRRDQDQAVSRPSNVKSRQDTTGQDENKPAGQSWSAAQPPQARLLGQEKSGFSPRRSRNCGWLSRRRTNRPVGESWSSQ
jgi:hypothetical protein